MFIIEDAIHAEQQDGEFSSIDDVLIELKKRAKIPFDKEPNRPPCTSWKTCERRYQIIEYASSEITYREIQRIDALKISAEGIEWIIDVNEL